jgi:hypothetical protein
MFLMRSFSIIEYLGTQHFAAVEQRRGHVAYFWNGLVFIDAENLPNRELMNWSCGVIDGHAVDTGGHLYYWLIRTPQLRWRAISNTSKIGARHGNLHYLPSEVHGEYRDGFDFEIHAGAFLHYSRGSNWANEGDDYHAAKTAFLTRIIQGCIDGSLLLPEIPSNGDVTSSVAMAGAIRSGAC